MTDHAKLRALAEAATPCVALLSGHTIPSAIAARELAEALTPATIIALLDEVEKLREALQPFADECDRWDGSDYTPTIDDHTQMPIDTCISDLVRARKALAPEGGE